METGLNGIISEIKTHMIKLKTLGIISLFVIYYVLHVTYVHADTVIDNGINYLKSKQDSTGKITTGFSAPSQWATIAFTANGVDVSSIKNGSISLKDFLLTDVPSEPSAATDWETRVLAIVAIGENPTNFGGTNYIQKLEGFYKDNQIGDTCSLNDDIFGLLALIASGSISTSQIKQDTLNFLITKQDPADGGFGFSAPGCAWYSTSADITAAALQTLQGAKDNGLTHAGLDEAITKAKAYLLANQNSDGGFGYYGTSDTDTTGWVVMAFNVLGMKDSEQVVKARNWLISQQSPTDGGFMAFDYSLNTSVSNASTTAQALIGLTGNTWLLKVFNQPTTTITPTQSPIATIPPTGASSTPTSSPSQSSSCSDTNPGIPVITDAIISDKNSVILKWAKAPNTVNHYLLAYGTSENSLPFGDSNIGGKDINSFEINKLTDGTTYYFKLKAVNGCALGDFSNTAIVTLGASDTDVKKSSKPVAQTPEILGAAVKDEISVTPTPPHVSHTQSIKQTRQPINKGLMSFSLLSFFGAIGYWYFKLKVS